MTSPRDRKLIVPSDAPNPMTDNHLSPEWHNLIQRIHAASCPTAAAVTGGGSRALADLLAVPGASRTLLEGLIPYSAASLTDWLGRRPEQFCSEETALAMASVTYRRAQQLTVEETPVAAHLVGIGCTAALVSERPKRGEHRCFVAAQTATSTLSRQLVLQKGARDRAGEEDLVGKLVLHTLAAACGLSDRPPLPLQPGDALVPFEITAHPLLAAVWQGESRVVWALPDDRWEAEPAEPPRGLLCGAFNPLHAGHLALRAAAERRLAGAVYYELSVTNVDKPPLDYLTIDRRRRQFPKVPLVLTHAPTFVEKAAALPGTTFVVGGDTAERIVQPRYYGGGLESVREALSRIRAAGCRFLVAGRAVEGHFLNLDEIPIPAGFTDLFDSLSAEEFRFDISSTELRRAWISEADAD
jgi:hypothetical protein